MDNRPVTGSDVRNIIEESCRCSTPVAIHLRANVIAGQARFSTLTEDSVVLDVFVDLESVDMWEFCGLSFYFRERPYIFLSSIQDYCERQNWRPAQLTVAVPTVIASVESRRAFRIPVAEGMSGLQLKVTDSDGKHWSPHLLNLSLTGMLVENAHKDDFQPEAYSRLQVELTLGDERVILRGVVRRQSGTQFGIFFSEVLKGGEIKPPPALKNIINTLETHWITNALETDENGSPANL